MDKPRSRLRARLLIFAVVTVSYFLISNYDAFDLPEYLLYALRIISLVVTFIGGLLFFTSIVPLSWLVVQLIRRRGLDRLAIWLLFLGALYLADFAFVRYVFLDFSRDRIIAKAQPLIVAIRQYRIDSGIYPAELDSLVPEYVKQLPKPSSIEWNDFRYENLDSTYQVSFTQWVHGRTCRSIVYDPTGKLVVPEYAWSSAYETGFENWKYFYY